MKKQMKLLAALLLGGILPINAQNKMNENVTVRPQMEKLRLTEAWDKVFPQSNKVEHRAVFIHVW